MVHEDMEAAPAVIDDHDYGGDGRRCRDADWVHPGAPLTEPALS